MKKELKDLILNAKKGDNTALKELLKQEQANIFATLFYLKKDETDIADIMQDVLIKLTKNIKNLRNVDNYKTWLNQIILNSYYDYARKNKKKLKYSENMANEEDLIEKIPSKDNCSNPFSSILYSELDKVIKQSINKLPIHYKIPITLREIQGLTYNEISNITKTSIGTIKSRIARARAILKSEIDKYVKG